MHLPHLPVPAVLLSVVYAAAIAVALTDPGQHALAGLLVLAGLTARWAVRARRSGAAAAPVAVAVAESAGTVDAVLGQEPATAPAPAAAA
ncbi:hypothetical protein DQ241_18545 [Blastococcus sp. TF02A-30]|nr:hypothetical protein DQ241_18545 [Blastococcus sp. TF02A-30]